MIEEYCGVDDDCIMVMRHIFVVDLMVISLHRINQIESLSSLEIDGHMEWASATVAAQGLDPASHELEVATEAMIQVAIMKGHMARLKSTFESIATKGKPPPPLALRERVTMSGEAGGTETGGRKQTVASVFPMGPGDTNGRYSSFRGELWLQPDCPPTQGACVQQQGAEGGNGVALVLGAGNRMFLSIIDMLHCLFVHNEVVLCKHHPLRAYQDRYVRAVFAPLIERGFVATILDTTLAAASHACYHSLVKHVHMTGGKPTHDAIVWGVGDEQASRKSRNEPKLQNATMTSELGAVTPWIVVPAQYSEDELKFQASHLARVIWDNISCNCNAPKVVLLSGSWPQKDAFVAEVKRCLRCLPAAVPYYPGAAKRYTAFQEAYQVPSHASSTELLTPFGDVASPPRSAVSASSGIPDDLPFLAIQLSIGSDGSCSNDYALKNEAFGPIICFATVEGGPHMDGSDASSQNAAAAFMAAAAKIANEKLFGSLSCTVILHPSTEKALPEACDRLVAELKYGCICINAWTALCYSMDTCSWGAFPGEELNDVASGIGVVQNTLLFDHVQKTVVRAPLVDKGQILHHPPPAFILVNVAKFLLRPGLGTFFAMAFPRFSFRRCCSYCLMVVLVLAVALYLCGVYKLGIHIHIH